MFESVDEAAGGGDWFLVAKDMGEKIWRGVKNRLLKIVF